MVAGIEFKRMNLAPGTVKSISSPVDDSPAVSEAAHAYSVCFTVDSFSDVPHSKTRRQVSSPFNW
jgi:hypothetical protein